MGPLFLSLMHLGRFFHEIFPCFQHSWINTWFFFIMAEKLWQYRCFLIFDELSSLHRQYMAIFAHPPNQFQLTMTLGCLRVGQLMHFLHIFCSCDKVLCDWLSANWARIYLSTISKTREISHTLLLQWVFQLEKEE